MRRDTFLKTMAAPAAANVKMMIPANPGGGRWCPSRRRGWRG